MGLQLAIKLSFFSVSLSLVRSWRGTCCRASPPRRTISLQLADRHFCSSFFPIRQPRILLGGRKETGKWGGCLFCRKDKDVIACQERVCVCRGWREIFLVSFVFTTFQLQLWGECTSYVAILFDFSSLLIPFSNATSFWIILTKLNIELYSNHIKIDVPKLQTMYRYSLKTNIQYSSNTDVKPASLWSEITSVMGKIHKIINRRSEPTVPLSWESLNGTTTTGKMEVTRKDAA